jgi:hypothetical protein
MQIISSGSDPGEKENYCTPRVPDMHHPSSRTELPPFEEMPKNIILSYHPAFRTCITQVDMHHLERDGPLENDPEKKRILSHCIFQDTITPIRR